MKTGTLKRFLCCTGAWLLLAALPVYAQTTTIGANFDGGSGNGGTAFDPGLVTGTAGVVPQANWNNLDTDAGGPSTLVDSTGSPTSATVSWSAGDTWSNSEADANVGNQNALLLNNYLDGGSGGTATVAISNIPYASYSLYVYGLHDSGNTGAADFSDYTVNGVTQDVLIGGTGSNDYNADGWVQATPSTFGDYVLFSNLTDSAITLQADLSSIGNFRSPIAGFEIVPNVVPEPSSLVLYCTGAFGLFFVGRRRLLCR
jgi:hypothetical protein